MCARGRRQHVVFHAENYSFVHSTIIKNTLTRTQKNIIAFAHRARFYASVHDKNNRTHRKKEKLNNQSADVWLMKQFWWFNSITRIVNIYVREATLIELTFTMTRTSSLVSIGRARWMNGEKAFLCFVFVYFTWLTLHHALEGRCTRWDRRNGGTNNRRSNRALEMAKWRSIARLIERPHLPYLDNPIFYGRAGICDMLVKTECSF